MSLCVPPLWSWGRSSPRIPPQCSSCRRVGPLPPRAPEDDAERSASPRCAPSTEESSPHIGSTRTGFLQMLQPEKWQHDKWKTSKREKRLGLCVWDSITVTEHHESLFLKVLTVSSSCLAVVCSVTLNTVKISGPGAPYTVTLCCCDTRFSSELNSCVESRRVIIEHIVMIFPLYQTVFKAQWRSSIKYNPVIPGFVEAYQWCRSSTPCGTFL